MPQIVLAQIASTGDRAAALLVRSGVVSAGHVTLLDDVAAIGRLKAPERVFHLRSVVVRAVNDLGTIRVKIVKKRPSQVCPIAHLPSLAAGAAS